MPTVRAAVDTGKVENGILEFPKKSSVYKNRKSILNANGQSTASVLIRTVSVEELTLIADFILLNRIIVALKHDSS